MSKKKISEKGSEVAKKTTKDKKFKFNSDALEDFATGLEKALNTVLTKYKNEDVSFEMITCLASSSAQLAAEMGIAKKDFLGMISEYFTETEEAVAEENNPEPETTNENKILN